MVRGKNERRGAFPARYAITKRDPLTSPNNGTDAIPAERIAQIASQHGIPQIGVSKPTPLWGSEAPLKRWLSKGFHGQMLYLEKNQDLRLNPKKLVENPAAIISAILPYKLSPTHDYNAPPRIAQYAHYNDYHRILKKKLYAVLADLKSVYPDLEGIAFTDSAPLNDRYWAVRSGLGWIGKNGLLINPTHGSLLWIGSLIISLPAQPTPGPIPSQCGPCKRCIKNCPTGALHSQRFIQANRCIAYRTIEEKPPTHQPDSLTIHDTHGWAFGCDLCQLACPFNSKAPYADSLYNELVIKKERLIEFAHGNATLPRHSPLRRANKNRLKRLITQAYQINLSDKSTNQ